MSSASPILEPPAAVPGRFVARRRTAVVVILILALAASILLQQWVFSYRQAAVNRNSPAGAPAPSRLSNLDSFSLALLLGGLRGPLVMYLWPKIESQKTERDLESVDTMIELVRLLQPEFDQVHLFQIWNKAYNISVQMASLGNKYAAILDAIEYAQRTIELNPSDINIVYAIGSLYADKLGSSSEKAYYRRRVRTETLPVYRVQFPASRAPQFQKAMADSGFDPAKVRSATGPDGVTTVTLEKLAGERIKPVFGGPDVRYEALPRQSIRPNTGGRRTELDTLVDVQGNLLPGLAQSASAGPVGGGELQYLARFQPFPYGISPLGLGYNYCKRAQVLQEVTKQRHLQMADRVVDIQPAHAMKNWAQEEVAEARRIEAQLFPRAKDFDKLPPELKAANIAPTAAVSDRASLAQAIFQYQRSSQLAAAAHEEFERHFKRYGQSIQNLQYESDALRGLSRLCAGDALYLQAIAEKDASGRAKLLGQVKDAYLEADRIFHVLVLTHAVYDQDAKAVGYSRAEVAGISLDELHRLYRKLNELLVMRYDELKYAPFPEHRDECSNLAARIAARLAYIK